MFPAVCIHRGQLRRNSEPRPLKPRVTPPPFCCLCAFRSFLFGWSACCWITCFTLFSLAHTVPALLASSPCLSLSLSLLIHVHRCGAAGGALPPPARAATLLHSFPPPFSLGAPLLLCLQLHCQQGSSQLQLVSRLDDLGHPLLHADPVVWACRCESIERKTKQRHPRHAKSTYPLT